MIRVLSDIREYDTCIPRESGDDPTIPVFYGHNMEYSPRERG